jgi:hypothetical protein
MGTLGVGFVSAIMMKLTFRFMLIKRAYTKEQFSQFIALSPFGRERKTLSAWNCGCANDD